MFKILWWCVSIKVMKSTMWNTDEPRVESEGKKIAIVETYQRHNMKNPVLKKLNLNFCPRAPNGSREKSRSRIWILKFYFSARSNGKVWPCCK